MSKPQVTTFAHAYVDSTRKRVSRDPTWADIAIAYDEGLRHGVEVDSQKRRKLSQYLTALRVINAVAAEATS